MSGKISSPLTLKVHSNVSTSRIILLLVGRLFLSTKIKLHTASGNEVSLGRTDERVIVVYYET